MGYEALDRVNGLARTEDLAVPARALPTTLRMLAEFAQHFGLHLAGDFTELFTCWNTGQPNGKTKDPAYVSNGLARMAIYNDLLPGKAISA